MKFVTFLMLMVCIVSCKSTEDNSSKTIKITPDDMESVVAYLASDELNGRNTGTRGINQAATFIQEKLKSLNIAPYFETYKDTFMANGKEAFNIVGYLEGNDKKLKQETIIIGAHYDHIGFGEKVEMDSIANGANDNASGVSAVLALAKYFSQKKSNKRSIIFTFFSAEEMGLIGSKHLAKKLKNNNTQLYTMVNFEMIGVPFKDRDYVAFITGYDLSNMVIKINEYAGSHLIGFSEIAKKYNLFKHSDNYAFYETFKLPCHTISTCDLSNYKYYHHVKDEAKEMDYLHMSNLINQIIPAIETMSNTTNKEIMMYEQN